MINEKILKDTFAKIRKDVEHQEYELKELKMINEKILKKINILKEDIKTIKNSGSTKLEKEIMKKFNRNKKDIIKHKMLEIIKFKQVTIPELKEIIVDQEEYCSKASFYRYLEEMRDLISLKNNKILAFLRI